MPSLLVAKMGYNPSYGGQFQGLQSSTQRSTGANKAAGTRGAGDGASGGRVSGVAGSSAPAPASTEPGEKVIVTLGGLKQVRLDELKEGDERYFIVVGLFEGDDLNSVVNHTRNRTQPVKAQLISGNYLCAFGGDKLVLPVVDPEKRFILYICAVTIVNSTDEQGKAFKDISLMGIGFSQPFEVKVCKKYSHTTAELRLVEGGDPNINPGKIEVSIDICKKDAGLSIPEDKEEYIMAQFQA